MDNSVVMVGGWGGSGTRGYEGDKWQWKTQ